MCVCMHVMYVRTYVRMYVPDRHAYVTYIYRVHYSQKCARPNILFKMFFPTSLFPVTRYTKKPNVDIIITVQDICTPQDTCITYMYLYTIIYYM